MNMDKWKPLRQNRELAEKAAMWFAAKWGIPAEAYLESIDQCLKQEHPIPRWYILLGEEDTIIAGVGVIENDFHDRTDLTPNVCALFVEEAYRKAGIAKGMLEAVRQDLERQGIGTLYLITDHTEFYEKCGWQFLTMVAEEGGGTARMYVTSGKQK